MANQEHLDIFKQGVKIWNQWRKEHLDIQLDLSEADFSRADFSRAILNEANLSRANFRMTNLHKVNFFKANLTIVDLSGADLSEADLRGADLRGADLSRADLSRADLREANLREANLIRATIVETNLAGAILTNCLIYGISAWDVKLEGATQFNLIITHPTQPTITVDNLEIAQFTYLLLNSQKVRDVVNSIATNVVLILGRFTPKRKAVLEVIREELRIQNYVPVLFDFENPSSRDFTETLSTLARMSRFIIADLTNPSSIPQELAHIVPDLPSVPVQPILESSGQKSYSMLADFSRYPWVLPVYQYEDLTALRSSINEKVIRPAEQKAKELREFLK